MGAESAVQLLQFDSSEQLPVRIAAPVDGELFPSRWLPPKLAKRADRYITLMAASAKSALADAHLVPDPERCSHPDVADRSRAGIVAGSAMGGMSALCGGVNALFQSSYRRMSPFCIPFAISNTGAALNAIDVGFEGPNYSANTACATGNHCISLAASHIFRGEADVMLAGASDAALLPAGLAGFAASRSLSTRNDSPKEASRPFDRHRDGFVMGEGSSMLTLESLSHARARGAKPLVEVAGFASNSDAFHMMEPDPSGRSVSRCMVEALHAASESACNVDLVNAHATSTQAGDAAELKAIEDAVGTGRALVNATKSMVGHMLGASSAFEAVACIKAIERGEVHPTRNFEKADDGVDAGAVVGKDALHRKVRLALSNSFGFGGHNAVLVLRKVE